jgi:hypothetical protein
MLAEYLERALSLERLAADEQDATFKSAEASGGAPKAGNEAYFSSSCPRARNASSASGRNG